MNDQTPGNGGSFVDRPPVVLMALSTAVLLFGAVWIFAATNWPLPARLIFGGLVLVMLVFEVRKLWARLFRQ